MLTTVWKVVKRMETADGDEYYTSAYVTDAGLCLEYRIEEWTYPTVGSLFAFSNRESAETFSDGVSGDTLVFSAAAERTDQIQNVLSYPSLREAVRFWASHVSGYARTPVGTVVCPAIKLEALG